MPRSPFTGVGIGLRLPHLELAFSAPPGVPFWEIAPENAIGEGGRQGHLTQGILARDPVISHGLSLSVGGYDPYDGAYLEQLADFLITSGSPWHSEHLCFTSVDGSSTHDLLPMPFTWASVHHTVARAKELKDRLPVPFLLENITYYTELGAKEMEENHFLAEVLEGADVGWLLDVNNVYVNALNFGFNPYAWLEGMPLQRVAQMHIAGHNRYGDTVVDTHGAPVIDPVIDLMRFALGRIGRAVPVLLERDNEIPTLEDLLTERAALQGAYDQALAVHA